MTRYIAMLVTMCLMAVNPVWSNTGTVTKVEAGDLIVIGDNWKTRISGIRVSDVRDPVGFRAFDFTKRHVEGAVVKLFTWTTNNIAAGIVRDENGLPRAKILFGKGWSEDLAERLLAQGLAWVDETMLPEDCEHYRAIEAEARRRGVGLWADN